MAGKLYLVATPIGNLRDITLRAIEVLREVDLIACEDTRHSRKLLSHLDISKPLISYHTHNEHQRSSSLIDRIASGESVALISDAGTPNISDPGHTLVADAIAAGIEVIPVPGPAAFVSAAAVSGLPTDTLLFAGFLPAKASERKRRLEQLSNVPATLAFYEAPHRLSRSLTDCQAVLGDRQAVIARELTKMHEEIVRGTLSQLVARFGSEPVKGEIVLLISGEALEQPAEASTMTLAGLVSSFEGNGMDSKSALKAAARELGISKSEAYRRMLQEK